MGTYYSTYGNYSQVVPAANLVELLPVNTDTDSAAAGACSQNTTDCNLNDVVVEPTRSQNTNKIVNVELTNVAAKSYSTPSPLSRAQRVAYEPSRELIQLVGTVSAVTDTFDVKTNDMNSIITLDLLDWDTKFPCPLCSALGEEVMLSVVTLSDHIGRHRYATVLAEKMVSDDPYFTQNARSDRDWNSLNTPDDITRERAINGILESETAYNDALRQSMMEQHLQGGLDEDAALTAAIAESEKILTVNVEKITIQ